MTYVGALQAPISTEADARSRLYSEVQMKCYCQGKLSRHMDLLSPLLRSFYFINIKDIDCSEYETEDR